eukprot:262891_1
MSRAVKRYQMYVICIICTCIIVFYFILMAMIGSWTDSTIRNSSKMELINLNVSSKTQTKLQSLEVKNNTLNMNEECFEYLFVKCYETPLYKLQIPGICNINVNSSYAVFFRINKTVFKRFHIIESVNEWDNGTQYALKTYPFYKKKCYTEYQLMLYLTNICIHNLECHTNKIFAYHYPLLRLTMTTNKQNRHYTAVIMEYLSNTIKYREFQKNIFCPRYYQQKHCSVEDKLQFINNCFKNVSIVLDQLWQKSILHNDLHLENIMVKTHYPYKCYLIDFNQMYKVTDKTDVEYRGFLSTQNPIHWYYLATYSDRNKYKLVNKNGNSSFYELKKYLYQSQRYRLYIFMLKSLISVLEITNRDKIKDFRHVFYEIDRRLNHVNTSDPLMNANMKNVWCCRMEETVCIINILKQYGYKRSNDGMNILDNMNNLYYQLQNELIHFNITCFI